MEGIKGGREFGREGGSEKKKNNKSVPDKVYHRP